MSEEPSDVTALSTDVADAFRRFGRVRARHHRETIEAAVDTVVGSLARHGVDRTAIEEVAARVEASVPQRYCAEFTGMAEELAVSEIDLRIYMFGTTVFEDALTAAGVPGAESSEGCSNVLVPADRSTTGTPLVFKNRDIKSRGFRPQVVLEAPDLGPYNGFLTMTTAGNVLVYQGINTAGLAVANTFVDNRLEDVPPEQRLRNGVVARAVLERCDTVTEAIDRVAALPTERSKGLTLFLADTEDSDLLEIDPAGERIESVGDGVTPRTNHFPGGDDEAGWSSALRLGRLQELIADLPTSVSPEDLDRIARDHRQGPGPNSICRHPTAGSGDPHTIRESTTVSSMVLVGGKRRMRAVHGPPCEHRPASYELRLGSLSELEERVGLTVADENKPDGS